MEILKDIKNFALGNGNNFELEHRCYNGVCLTAGLGCVSASVLNSAIGLPIQATLATMTIGLTYLWLYLRSRRSVVYQPVLWLYILSGIILLAITWFYNGGINGSDTFVSMVALLAMTVVLKSRRFLVALTIFFPTVSVLFLLEYLYPEFITGYSSHNQRFLDVYLAFTVSTVVIYSIVSLILESHGIEKKRLKEANRLIEDKMETLNRANLDLEAALAKVRTLNGLLPICSSCKKIRDDKGYWNQLESYIHEHYNAEFSHSICPECSQRLYPDLDINKYDILKKKDDDDNEV